MSRILVVDDEPLVREFIRRALESAGHSVSEAQNGSVATGLAKLMPFDLVITDMIMPQKEGLETVREIRDTKPEARILAISGQSNLDLAKELGADGVLAKPFRKPDLLAAVDALLS